MTFDFTAGKKERKTMQDTESVETLLTDPKLRFRSSDRQMETRAAAQQMTEKIMEHL
jgi:hypothetical protein